MPNSVTNIIDDKLLGLLQSGFPLTAEPYAEICLKIGATAQDVMRRIADLKASGIVREISPVLDARKLGYQSTLVAMEAGKDKLAPAEKVLSEHPGVSHAYERDHKFNIWFTLSLPQKASVDAELKKLSSLIGAEATFALPAIKVFKLRAKFGPDEDGQSEDDNGQIDTLSSKIELTAMERRVINALQKDLPLREDPFHQIAKGLDISVAVLLEHCHSLVRSGAIRRYGASINHYKIGYKANAMTCWKAPPDRVESVAAGITLLRQVSHCYERAVNPLWKYNLYVMIHGHSKTACLDIVDKIRSLSGIDDYAVLFSTHEFKKTRIKYLV
jgi:siroheme decarboxylase